MYIEREARRRRHTKSEVVRNILDATELESVDEGLRRWLGLE
jgi:hypothetical protein